VKKTTWTEFLKAHWDVLAAADFFTVDVWTRTGLTRFAVLFIIELSTRRIEIAGITSEPNADWMSQGIMPGPDDSRWGSLPHAGGPRIHRTLSSRTQSSGIG
jgi:hypothetical protein